MALIDTARDDGVSTQRYSVEKGLADRYNASNIKERLAGKQGPGVDFFDNKHAPGFTKTPLIGFSNIKGIGFGGTNSKFEYQPFKS